MATTHQSTRIWRSMLQQYVSGRPLHAVGRRAFSCTPRAGRSLPAFEPSSSQDLDGLLTLIRQRILLTSFLNESQRELVLHPKWRSTLENEPVYATVGDEEVQLQPLDRFRDLPNRWKSWNAAIKLAKTKDDWANMVKLLEGYHAMLKGQKMDTGRLQNFVRRARSSGQVGRVWECLRKVDSTGLTLRDTGVAQQVFIGCVSEELRAKGYSDDAVKKAWTSVLDLLQLLEMPGHCGGAIVDGDIRQQPWVLGVVVEVAALWQKMRWPAGDGPKQELQTRVDRLLDCVKIHTLENTVSRIQQEFNDVPIPVKNARTISTLLPIYNGASTAQELVGNDYARAAELAQVTNTSALLIDVLIEELEEATESEKPYWQAKVWRELRK